MSQHDERTVDTVKRYLHFFKIPGFLEKKWKKKVKDTLDEWFASYDALEESVSIKDEKLEDLSIDELLTVLDAIQRQFADGATDLSALNDAIESMLTELLTSMDLYCAALQSVVDEQNGYEWYTPKCYAFLSGNTLYLGYGNPPAEGDYYGSATVTAVWTDFESTGSAPWQSVKSSIFEVRTLSSFTHATVTAVSMWFNGCANLTTCDLTYFNTRSVTAASNFMTGCDSLTTVILGRYTEIFMRFDNLVSQMYWYTDDTVLDGEKLYLAAYPGTYYSTSPMVTLTVSVQGLEDYDDDVTVTVTMSDGSVVTVICNSDNDYCGALSVSKYSGRDVVYAYEVKAPEIEGYSIGDTNIEDLYVTIVYTIPKELYVAYFEDTQSAVCFYGTEADFPGASLYAIAPLQTTYVTTDYENCLYFTVDSSVNNYPFTERTVILTYATSLQTADVSACRPEILQYLTLYQMSSNSRSYTQIILPDDYTVEYVAGYYLGRNITISSGDYNYVAFDRDVQLPMAPNMRSYYKVDGDVYFSTDTLTATYSGAFNLTCKTLYMDYGTTLSSTYSYLASSHGPYVTAENGIYITMTHGCDTLLFDMTVYSPVYVTGQCDVFTYRTNRSGTSITSSYNGITLSGLDLSGVVCTTAYTFLGAPSGYVVFPTCDYLYPYSSVSSYVYIYPFYPAYSSLQYVDFSHVKNVAVETADASRIRLNAGDASNSTNFTTIYMGEETSYFFEESETQTNTIFFTGCSSLVGGNGTVYRGNDVSFFVIDTDDHPGYGTLKAVTTSEGSNDRKGD